jgi:hypothetical protein
MNTSSTRSYATFGAYLALTFYCLGAAVYTEWLEYQALTNASSGLSAVDVAAWNMASPQESMYFLTVPSIALTAIVLALFKYLPVSVPRGPLWGVLACQLIVWSVFLLAQVPLDMQAEQNTLVNLLVHSDWVRKLALLIEAPLALYMTFRAFSPLATARPAAVLNGGARKTPVMG